MTPLRARLMSPPNAVPDTGINMRNGKAIPRPVPVPPPCTWTQPKLTLVWRWTPPPQIPEVRPAVAEEQPPGIKNPMAIAILIINEICVVYGIPQYQLISSYELTAESYIPRQAAMAIVRRLTPFSLSEVGRLFDGRDHSTVAHARRKLAHHIAALNQELTDWSTPAEWVRALKARLEA